MERFNKFIEIIRKYAEAYKDLEDIQKEETYYFVPEKGDQKTGLIGESFIYEYLKRKGYLGLSFGNHSQKAWDIKYDFGLAPNNVVLVQVKTVSAFAKGQSIGTIHFADDYCELYLVSLDENMIPNKVFKPGGYDPKKIKNIGGQKMVRDTRMPKDKNDTFSGFTKIEDIFDDFKETFPELYK
jgi:hypothetical protein